MVNRREFFKILLATYASKFIPAPKPIPGTWGAVERSIYPFWKPYPAQVEFMSRPLDTKWILNSMSYSVSGGERVWAAPLWYVKMIGEYK